MTTENEENYLTCRELRCIPQSWPLDVSKSRDVLKFTDGDLKPEGSPFKYFEVVGNKLIATLKHSTGDGACVDDLIAIARDIAVSDTRPDKYKDEAIVCLNQAIVWFDKRAESIHGYSESKRERNFVPRYKYEELEL